MKVFIRAILKNRRAIQIIEVFPFVYGNNQDFSVYSSSWIQTKIHWERDDKTAWEREKRFWTLDLDVPWCHFNDVYLCKTMKTENQ